MIEVGRGQPEGAGQAITKAHLTLTAGPACVAG